MSSQSNILVAHCQRKGLETVSLRITAKRPITSTPPSIAIKRSVAHLYSNVSLDDLVVLPMDKLGSAATEYVVTADPLMHRMQKRVVSQNKWDATDEFRQE